MCLSGVLLVNKYHYWFIWKYKMANFVVKPSVIVQEKWLCHEKYCFLCERETSLWYKYSALYLVSIYVWIYLHICVYMCIMNMYVHGFVSIFSCSTCYLGLKITTSFCSFYTLRFNKAYTNCSCNHPPCEVDLTL